ncbi:L,D-transpeptidase family protein [Nitratireductor luteus]|uniref:L,D-transpeptidase family protein n=1 Tax=Nitratireductor luteus TaxID=2976980 RepID=UPI00223FB63D|nr:L,D-transpeptidase family protein [Nitratireductor luteus]
MEGNNKYLFDGALIIQERKQHSTDYGRPRKVLSLHVRPTPGNPRRGLLRVDGLIFRCALGRGGISAFKREGDGATPFATMRPLEIYYRRDRRSSGLARARLPVFAIRGDMGWCDAVADANYNRQVPLPFAASHEKMLREDHLYDTVVVLDWNVRPRKRGAGSAIFLHIARPGFQPTEGCIAVTQGVMTRLLPLLGPRTRITVHR